MPRTEHPEAPTFLTGRRAPASKGQPGFAFAVVVGEGGTTVSATAERLPEATLMAQECFWRTTAEGACQ